MKELLTIGIVDKDSYFIQGLETILRHHFIRQGIPFLFLSEKQSINAKLLFLSIGLSHNTLFCRQCHEGTLHGVIIVQETTCASYQSRNIPACPCEKNIINRRISVSELLKDVDRVLATFKAPHHKCRSGTRSLSERERQILSALGEEIRASQIAVKMNLSPKTVSTYKRNAMKKIGLTGNIALYHWLRNGGLGTEMKEFS